MHKISDNFYENAVLISSKVYYDTDGRPDDRIGGLKL